MDVFMSRVLEFKSSSSTNKKNSIYTYNYKGFLKVTELISEIHVKVKRWKEERIFRQGKEQPNWNFTQELPSQEQFKQPRLEK